MAEGENTIISTAAGSPIEVKMFDDIKGITKELAMMLYSYADFSKIQSNKDFARVCIQRAKDFADVYVNFSGK